MKQVIISLFLVFMLGFSAAQAQSAAPGSTGPAPQATTDVPLDGGASLLLAGSIGYGLKRLRKRCQA